MALLSAALRSLRDWGDCALSLAFPWPHETGAAAVRIEPPFCDCCGEPFPEVPADLGPLLCAVCAERRWHFGRARAGYVTGGEVLEAIVGFKYHEQYYRYRRLVEWLVEAFDRHLAAEGWDGLVPVPLHHRRRRDRGFNQAAELARGLGRSRGLPVFHALYRCRETGSQTGLERMARWENMSGAFRLKAGFDARGQNLILVDDVFTTGATTDACAQVLAEGGAGRLAVLTVARS